MSNSIKLLIGLAAVFLAISVFFVNYSLPHLWHSVGKASVTFADGASGTAEVYNSRNGDFLFSIREQPPEVYIYAPSTRLVGIPNGDQFVFIPLFAFSKDVPVPVVFSNNLVKVDTDMKISVEGTKIGFTTFSGRRIEADLSNFETK